MSEAESLYCAICFALGRLVPAVPWDGIPTRRECLAPITARASRRRGHPAADREASCAGGPGNLLMSYQRGAMALA